MKKENKFKKLWNYFSTYEKCWYFSIIVLSLVIAFLFPEEDVNGVNGWVIMTLYLLDIVLNITCELLISKQSKWNFIVSLAVEVCEIVTLILIASRFATMAITLFFWIPCDIISFVVWNKNKDKKDEELTVVRKLKPWQTAVIILAIAVWTVGVGYLLTLIEVDGIIPFGTALKDVECYLDACASAVGIANGVFILLRYREQWLAWYICCALEIALNIILGQWVLLVLKLGYLTNTTYGYIKWTKYINSQKKNEIVVEAKASEEEATGKPENLAVESVNDADETAKVNN